MRLLSASTRTHARSTAVLLTCRKSDGSFWEKTPKNNEVCSATKTHRDDKDPTVSLRSSHKFASCAFTSSGSSRVLCSARPTSEAGAELSGLHAPRCGPRKRRDASEYALVGKMCGLRGKKKRWGACSWDQFTFAQNRGIMLDLLLGWGFTMCCS